MCVGCVAAKGQYFLLVIQGSLLALVIHRYRFITCRDSSLFNIAELFVQFFWIKCKILTQLNCRILTRLKCMILTQLKCRILTRLKLAPSNPQENL